MKKRANKKHKPLDPRGWIVSRMPLSQDQTDDLEMAYRMALQAMLTGHGDEQAFCTVAASLNIALLMCERGIYAEEIETIKTAIDALVSCRYRANRTGKWAYSGEEMKAVKAAVAVHDLQCEIATKRQASMAILGVRDRIESGVIA